MSAKFDYSGAASDAEEIIRFFGMGAVLRRAGATPTDRPCVVAIVEYLPRDDKAALANPTDRHVIMAVTPEVAALPPDNEQDQLVTFVQPPANPPVEDEVLPLTCKPKPTSPAGIPVIWEFTVRR